MQDSGTALPSLAPKASPAFSGTVTLPDGTTNSSTGYTFATPLNLPNGSKLNGSAFGSVATLGTGTLTNGDVCTYSSTSGFVCNSTLPAGYTPPAGSGFVHVSGGLQDVAATALGNSFQVSSSALQQITQFSFSACQNSGCVPTTLTSSMVIFAMLVAQPFTIPVGATVGNCTSSVSFTPFGTLPAAAWTATLARVPAGSTTAISFGSVSVSTAGVNTWIVSAAQNFSTGDTIELIAPSTVDNSAANPSWAQCVVK